MLEYDSQYLRQSEFGETELVLVREVNFVDGLIVLLAELHETELLVYRD